MSSHSSNSRKRYACKARDSHQLVYNLKCKEPIFPIVFKGRKVLPPCDDPLVVTVKIAHCEVCIILVDNGSSSHLLYMSTLLDIGIDPKEITQQKIMLVGFNGSVTMIMRTIRLSVFVEGTIIIINFIVSSTPTSYNVILGGHWICKMRGIPSIYHQLIKYPTINRIREIKGE